MNGRAIVYNTPSYDYHYSSRALKKPPKTLLGTKQVTQLGYLGNIIEALMANTPIA
jgi:hypothetical protein